MTVFLQPQTSGVPLPDHSIDWYRTPIPAEVKERLHLKSDAKGLVQTLGFLGILLGSGALAMHFSYTPYVSLATAFVLLYGLVANFLINGMHELGHGSVFATPWLNGFFVRVVSFLGWLHPDMFFSSHLRHHRFTQNAPYDQENPMPIKITAGDFWGFGFVNVKGCYEILQQTLFAALGVYPTGHLGWLPGWEEVCYPSALPAARLPAMRWAQFMLGGHALIAAASISRGCYLLPFLLSFGPFYNGWLFFLCNATQHVGMHPQKNDFRLNTRTFYLNPVVRFLYWHMNWHTVRLLFAARRPVALVSLSLSLSLSHHTHTRSLSLSPTVVIYPPTQYFLRYPATPPPPLPSQEHHMYANVPCYNLWELHEAIKHDLPPTPNGLVEVWSVIAQALERQAKDPSACCEIALPPPSAKQAASQ